MKKPNFFTSLLAIATIFALQNNAKAQTYQTFDKNSKVNKLNISSLSEVDENNYTMHLANSPSEKLNENKYLGAAASNEEEDKPDKGKLYFRESFLQGSIRTGLRYFATQKIVNDAEIVVFEESDVFNTSFNFFRRTNTPTIAAQAEYMIFDGVGVGGFLGVFGSFTENTNTSIQTTQNEILGTVFGGFVEYATPIENWLYSSTELVGSYETGVLKTRDTDDSKEASYNFSRITANLVLAASYVPTERLTFSIGGLGVGYSSYVFTGSGTVAKTDIDPDTNQQTTSTQFIDNKVKGNEFGFRASPTISAKITVFSPGGR